LTETYREYIVVTVNFENRQHKQRVDFVGQQIAATRELLESNYEVRSRVGEDIVAGFAEFADTYFVPKQSHGVYVMTPEQQNGNGHPVIAAAMGETVRFSREFSTLTITQRQIAAETIAAWGPLRSSPYGVLLSAARPLAEYYARPMQLFDRRAPGRATVLAARHMLYQEQFTAAPTRQAELLARPVTALSLPDSLRNELDEPSVLHEYKHVEQAADDPIVSVPDTAYGLSTLHLSDERAAYTVAVDAIRGIATSRGAVSTDIISADSASHGYLVQREALRIISELMERQLPAGTDPSQEFIRRIATYMDDLYATSDTMPRRPRLADRYRRAITVDNTRYKW
jgi:hypothetical protein